MPKNETGLQQTEWELGHYLYCRCSVAASIRLFHGGVSVSSNSLSVDHHCMSENGESIYASATAAISLPHAYEHTITNSVM